MIKEVEIYKAVGEETRLRMMRILLQAGVKLCACEIIDVLEKPQYTVSKSLGVLVQAGLITERREGRMMFYQLVETDFNKPLFEGIKLIRCNSNPVFETDFDKLTKRLSLRENGVCTSDCKN